MAKNLAHSLSPVNIGLKLDPTFPTRNDTSGNKNNGTYRTDAGVKTVEAGDIVRIGKGETGSVFGVVWVDHLDKLSLMDTEPVINFGLNVWYIKNIVKTAVVGTGHKPGDAIWYFDPYVAGSTIKSIDSANSKAGATGKAVFVGKPLIYSNYNSSGANIPGISDTLGGHLWKIGTLLDSIDSTLARGAIISDEVRVILGGSGTPITGESFS